MTFGPDMLRDAIVADFALRGVTAEVAIGEWNTTRHNGSPYVVIGLARGQMRDPGGMRRGGGLLSMGGGTVARTLLVRDQAFTIWVHGVAADSTPPDDVATEARRATAALLDATAAALRRAAGGLASTPWAVDWVGEERGEFIYGSLAILSATVSLMVPDDAMATISVSQVEASVQAIGPDGSVMPATPETSTETT